MEQLVQIRILLAHAVDFFNRVNDGGVMLSAEGATDLRQGCFREFLDQVHGHLPGIDDRLGIALFLELRLLNLEAFRNRLLNRID